MKDLDDVDIKRFYENLKALKYDQYRRLPGTGKSTGFKCVSGILPKRIVDIAGRFASESESHQCDGIKLIIPSKIIDIWPRFEVSLGLKLFGRTDIPTQASNLIV